MVRKLLFTLAIVAAVVFALWRSGFIDKGRVSDKASELQERAVKEAKEAQKAAREAVDAQRR